MYNGIDKVILVPGELNSTTEYPLPHLAKLFPKSNVVKATNVLTKITMKLTGKVTEIPVGNEHVYRLTSETDNRVIQFLWITTKIKDTRGYLNTKFSDWHFRGVKLH